MLLAGTDGFADAPLEIADTAGIVEKRYVLFPGQTNHHTQAVFQSNVEQPPRWHGVGANGVDVVRLHERKIAFDRLRVVILAAIGFWFERTVGNAAHVKLFVANENELSGGARARRSATGER